MFFYDSSTTSQKEKESNGSPIFQDPAPIPPTIIHPNPRTPSPTTKTNTLLIRMAMVYLIGFILCGIIFCEYLFYYDLVENVIIGILKNGIECEFKNENDCELAELLYRLYCPIPEPTDTPPPTPINSNDSDAKIAWKSWFGIYIWWYW